MPSFSIVGLIAKMAKQPKAFPSGAKALSWMRKEGLGISTQTFYREWRSAKGLMTGEKLLSKLNPTTMLKRSMIPTTTKKLLNNYLIFTDVTFYDRVLKKTLTKTVSLYSNRLKRIDSFMHDVKELMFFKAADYNTTVTDILKVKFRTAIRMA